MSVRSVPHVGHGRRSGVHELDDGWGCDIHRHRALERHASAGMLQARRPLRPSADLHGASRTVCLDLRRCGAGAPALRMDHGSQYLQSTGERRLAAGMVTRNNRDSASNREAPTVAKGLTAPCPHSRARAAASEFLNANKPMRQNMEPRPSRSEFHDDAEPLLTPSDVASIDNVSVKTVLRWIEKRILPAFKLGGQWRISPRDHRSFLHQRWRG